MQSQHCSSLCAQDTARGRKTKVGDDGSKAKESQREQDTLTSPGVNRVLCGSDKEGKRKLV